MESPMKKLDFNPADKENNPDAAVATLTEEVDTTIKPVIEEVKRVEEKTETTVEKIDESDEPLLRENPGRFVLFPIKYHEVCDASNRVKWSTRDFTASLTWRHRSGKCTRRPRPRSGLLRRLICLRIFMIGTTV
jgi:hypothetical protein